MSPWIPRVRSGERMLCQGCKQSEEHKQTTASAGEPMAAIQTVAHDSGDGATIYHCPFCGSGQVIARSDRSTECEYCHQCFTVQVQPQFPAFPQTINGMPMQVPGLPGAPGGLPAQPDPMGDPMAGAMPPDGDPNDPNAMQEGPGGDPGAGPEQDEEAPEDDGDDAPPWAKGSSLRTTAGVELGWDNYVRHLAIKHADDKDAVISSVRAERTAP